jgi:hypothetical protein
MITGGVANVIVSDVTSNGFHRLGTVIEFTAVELEGNYIPLHWIAITLLRSAQFPDVALLLAPGAIHLLVCGLRHLFTHGDC